MVVWVDVEIAAAVDWVSTDVVPGEPAAGEGRRDGAVGSGRP